MSKYKIGEHVGVPYGGGDTGHIVDIKTRLFCIPLYIVRSDSYVTMNVFYRYFGWNIWHI